jgi:TldD protein
MNELAEHAVGTARTKGADYADVRIIDTRRQTLRVRNGRITNMDLSGDLGFGVRVLVDGAWGFAASNRVEKSEIERVAAEAVRIAKASGSLPRGRVTLAPEAPVRDRWATPILIDPFTVSDERKLEILFAADEALRTDDRIKVAMTSMTFGRERQWLATSEGTFVDQTLMSSGAGMSATAVEKGETQVRSYPNSHGGQNASLGWELVESFDLPGNADRVREEAVALLSAKPCPSGKKDLILGGTQLFLQIHESVGHATELDRVLGYEEDFAGRSFATPEKLGDFRYGSEVVNLVADSTVPTGLATIGYDDEGVAAQRWHIVQDGIFKGYLTSRELAHEVGEERSRGAMRAQGWSHVPIIRITNLSLMPGDWTLDDLVADTEDGLMFETNRSWSIDQWRLNFQFGCEIGWEIKNGKRGDMVKNPSYQGVTPEFWNSCDAVTNEDHWVLWGVPNCGKGQPMQVAEMSHGCSPTRFRGVTVGIGS